jgi:hypothetical protein
MTLFALPEFCEELKGLPAHNGSLSKLLVPLLEQVSSGGFVSVPDMLKFKAAFDKTSVSSSTKKRGADFPSNQQHDATEFLNAVLDDLNEEFRSSKESPPDIVGLTERFKVNVTKSIRCTNCGSEHQHSDIATSLMLAMPPTSPSSSSSSSSSASSQEMFYLCREPGNVPEQSGKIGFADLAQNQGSKIIFCLNEVNRSRYYKYGGRTKPFVIMQKFCDEKLNIINGIDLFEELCLVLRK